MLVSHGECMVSAVGVAHHTRVQLPVTAAYAAWESTKHNDLGPQHGDSSLEPPLPFPTSISYAWSSDYNTYSVSQIFGSNL